MSFRRRGQRVLEVIPIVVDEHLVDAEVPLDEFRRSCLFWRHSAKNWNLMNGPPQALVRAQVGTGGPVGSGYVSRESCDRQTLTSPGRWHISNRRHPSSVVWRSVAGLHGGVEMFLRLASEKEESISFWRNRVFRRWTVRCHVPSILQQ